ncbi:MAG: hypothetical protein DMG85_22130 [Acidobacteria bacterium]|nr:MAG: hypothetical protein DMG85_22130 [Acidobacteriota bacterium]
MQKTILGGVLILCALSARTQTNRNTAPAIYIGAADIQATLKKAPADSVTDQAIRTVAVGNLNVGVAVVHRSAQAAQTSVAHDELTEIYHVLAGSGTLVTGGTLTKPERFPADSQTVKELAGPSMHGTGLENGVIRKVRAGDVVIIPAGTGHWFSSIDGAIDYEVLRVDPQKLLSLK